MLVLEALLLMTIRLTSLIHSPTHIINDIDAIILNQHNEWRSLIANGHINNHPNGANIEKLLWEYNIEEMSKNYSNKCDTNILPEFNINKLNNINFSFVADFNKYSFGHNSAYIKIGKYFDFMKDKQELENITKYLINQWFKQHNNYIFGDSVKENTKNYFNAGGGVTRYIGCSINECNIFLCNDCNCFPNGKYCIRYIYLNCFYFPSIQNSQTISDNKLYLNGNECSQCTNDRNNICLNGLCSDCPSHNYYKCQNDNSCNQTPNNPCNNIHFAKNCPYTCDNKCKNLTNSNHNYICNNQPILQINPTFEPTFEPTEAPTDSPTDIPIITNIQTFEPTESPTNSPIFNPTNTPSITPIKIPTIDPTNIETFIPSDFPSFNPTNTPSITPTIDPTNFPIYNPSNIPTNTPFPSDSSSIEITDFPTINPSISPTNIPSQFPSLPPTELPTTNIPTELPLTFEPTVIDQTINPSISPTIFPTINPSISHTNIPSKFPTVLPTFQPSNHPSDYEFKCGINFLPFSEYTKCTHECNGGKMKRTRSVYYYGCSRSSDSITYLGKQIVSKKCNTHKCIVA